MTYLIETDRAIDYLKGRSAAVELLQALAEDGLAISLISYGEIYEGIYYGGDPRRHEQDFQRFLRLTRVLPLTRRIMQRFARLRGQLRRQGTPVGELDLLIAATALEHDLTLVTRNQRHFSRIAGLAFYADAEDQ